MNCQNYKIHKIEVPTGRVIGDNNCSYEFLDVFCLQLLTEDGLEGWGYEGTCWKGKFSKPAWYIKPMPALVELDQVFLEHWWPRLRNLSPESIREQLRSLPASPHSFIDMAVGNAVYDLCAKAAGLPLFRYLGGASAREKIPAYGSILDFHLNDEEALQLTDRFLKRGMRAIKVKIGSEDVARDIRRLRLIRDAVPAWVEITADANTAWTAAQTISRLADLEEAGIRLGYLEDPLPPDDLEGFRKLASSSLRTDIIAHDYVNRPDALRSLLETGALKRIRVGKEVEYALACAALAEEFDVPMIFGNSMFEFNVHLACAFPRAERLEFSDLAWNQLLQEPVGVEGGYAFPSARPGHGLEPDPAMLERWACPGLS